MKTLIHFFLLAFIITNLGNAGDKGIFGPSKPKPGKPVAVVEQVLNATEKSYQILKEIDIKTDKGNVKFTKGFYVVSQDYISQNDENQNKLISILQTAVDLKKQNSDLKITTYTCGALCLILLIFNIILLKRRTGI